MSRIDIKIDTEHKIVSVRIDGQSTMLEVAEAYGKALDDPKFEFNMNAFWDMSGVNITRYAISEFRTISGLLGKYRGKRGDDYLVALVTNRTADFQLLRLYSAILRLVGSFRLRVFSRADEALEWLQSVKKEPL